MLKMGSVLLVLFNFIYAKFCYFSSLGIARCTVPIRGFKMERVYWRSASIYTMNGLTILYIRAYLRNEKWNLTRKVIVDQEATYYEKLAPEFARCLLCLRVSLVSPSEKAPD